MAPKPEADEQQQLDTAPNSDPQPAASNEDEPARSEADGIEKQGIPLIADGEMHEVHLGEPTPNRKEEIEVMEKEFEARHAEAEAEQFMRDSKAKAKIEALEATQRAFQDEYNRVKEERRAQDANTLEPFPDSVTLADGRTFIATDLGLPNTCSETGERCVERWFALNVQAARAGRGICEAHLRELMKAVVVKNALPLDAEQLAQVLHEAGREAVAKNLIVRTDVPTRGFIEWADLTEEAREGRRVQARFLLARFDITAR